MSFEYFFFSIFLLASLFKTSNFTSLIKQFLLPCQNNNNFKKLHFRLLENYTQYMDNIEFIHFLPGENFGLRSEDVDTHFFVRGNDNSIFIYFIFWILIFRYCISMLRLKFEIYKVLLFHFSFKNTVSIIHVKLRWKLNLIMFFIENISGYSHVTFLM